MSSSTPLGNVQHHTTRLSPLNSHPPPDYHRCLKMSSIRQSQPLPLLLLLSEGTNAPVTLDASREPKLLDPFLQRHMQIQQLDPRLQRHFLALGSLLLKPHAIPLDRPLAWPLDPCLLGHFLSQFLTCYRPACPFASSRRLFAGRLLITCFAHIDRHSLNYELTHPFAHMLPTHPFHQDSNMHVHTHARAHTNAQMYTRTTHACVIQYAHMHKCIHTYVYLLARTQTCAYVHPRTEHTHKHTLNTHTTHTHITHTCMF